MKPGLAHALIALALQGVIALPLAFLLRIDAVAAVLTGGVLAMAFGAVFAIGFYLGRERKQSECAAGSNRIPPWRWQSRALRDLAWPALAVTVAAALVETSR